MLENCQSAQERWGGVSEIIDRWLRERQELLVRYCQLTEIVDDEDTFDLESELGKQLQSFCQILVDYISAGHFEIYDQLVQEGRDFDDQEGLKKAGELFKQIDKTTEFVLDFNDKYQETDDLETLNNDLSQLGEVLAHRFEPEDQMIEVLHVAHKDHVA